MHAVGLWEGIWRNWREAMRVQGQNANATHKGSNW